jgi:DNA-binding response OmpR family regulator
LEIQLSGMSGLDLQRRLGALGSDIPVIMLAAFDDARVRNRHSGWAAWPTSTGPRNIDHLPAAIRLCA